MTGLTSSKTQLNSLQLLRALAAVSVVYFHLKTSLNFGSFGVDIFFVLSGFVIAMVAERQPTALHFASYRLTRVVPLYWLMTLGLFLLAVIAPGLLNSTTASMPNLLKSLFFIPYFKENGALQPLLAVGWTLNYEIFFYLIVTAILAIAPRRVFWGTAICVVLAYGIGHLGSSEIAITAFLQKPYLFEFILGMVAYRMKDCAWMQRIPLGVAAILVVGLYALMARNELAPFANMLVMYGVPSFLLILAMVRLEPFFTMDKTWVRMGVFLGDASYAIYLVHFYVVEGMRKLVVPHAPFLALDSWLGGTVTLLLALIVGGCCYRYVGWPMVVRARRLLPPSISSSRYRAVH